MSLINQKGFNLAQVMTLLSSVELNFKHLQENGAVLKGDDMRLRMWLSQIAKEMKPDEVLKVEIIKK